MISPTFIFIAFFRRDIHESAEFITQIRLSVITGFTLRSVKHYFAVGREHFCFHIFNIFAVNMHAPDVRFDMEKSAGIIDRTGRIEGTGQIIDRRYPVPVVVKHIHVREITCQSQRTCRSRFIERTPDDDGGVIAVPLNDLPPFSKEIFPGLRIFQFQAPVAVLSPGQISEAVGMVKVTFIKNFLMQTRPVESGCFAQFDIPDQRRIIRCCPDPLRIIPLIKYKTGEKRFVIQIQTVFDNGNFPQTGV